MMTPRLAVIVAALLALIAPAGAQLATSLQLSKRNYILGEPVLASVTVTNYSGRELIFASDSRVQWLDFFVKDSSGRPVTTQTRKMFGAMKIGAGQSMARQIDLTELFQFSQPGNFTVSAVVRMPGSTTEGSSTNREMFTLNPGRTYWSQKVGLPARPGETREFKIITSSGNQRNQLYAQVVDGRTGQNIRTFLLGDSLSLRRPTVTVDGAQRMHVLFLSTPAMSVHCQIDTDGRLVSRTIHQRAAEGDPQLVSFPDGSVRVSNSVPYDPQAAANARSRVRKISERPAIVYD
jgi:hypothetical protein